jgi:hypothetical protein
LYRGVAARPNSARADRRSRVIISLGRLLAALLFGPAALRARVRDQPASPLEMTVGRTSAGTGRDCTEDRLRRQRLSTARAEGSLSHARARTLAWRHLPATYTDHAGQPAQATAQTRNPRRRWQRRRLPVPPTRHGRIPPARMAVVVAGRESRASPRHESRPDA